MDYGATRFTVDASASIYALHEQRTICGRIVRPRRRQQCIKYSLPHCPLDGDRYVANDVLSS
jgi:hypothetical protein